MFSRHATSTAAGLATTLLALGLATTLLVAPSAAVKCSGGLGDQQWCTRGEGGATPGHKVTQCPKICQKRTCEGVKPADGERRGISEVGDDDDDDSDGEKKRMNWEEIARTGLYEHIYAEDDKYLCLASCWYEPWNGRCQRWEEAFNRKYCLHLNCEHDTKGEVGGNRFAGCHADDGGNLKLDWHKPTCNECIHLFPACYDELKEYSQWEDVRPLRSIVRVVDSYAQEVCYNNYFSYLSSVNPYARSGSQGRRLAASDDDSDGGKDDSDDKESGSNGPEDGLNGPSWVDQVQDIGKMLAQKELGPSGQLQCPEPQCLTDNVVLLMTYADVTWPTVAPPTPPPSPVEPEVAPNAPWYQTTSEGYCSMSCSGTPEGGAYCNTSLDNCMRCKGLWCPPTAMANVWNPVTDDPARGRKLLFDDPAFMTFDTSTCPNKVTEGYMPTMREVLNLMRQ